MTKKHFIQLADKIKELSLINNPSKDTMISYLADFCQEQNPQFNRERWISYINGECGPSGGKVKA